MHLRLRRLLVAVSALATLAVSADFAGAQKAPNPNRPTLFLIGDVSAAALQGLFNADHLKVQESAANGQTSRAYLRSGGWDRIAAQIKPGDLVLIEFKADDEQGQQDTLSRTLQGMGDGTFDYIDPGSHKLELVHSYGWYLRKMVVDSINHGANPILCSPPNAKPVNAGTSGQQPGYADWAQAIATEQRIPFVDLGGAGTVNSTSLRKSLEALKPDPLAPYLTKE